MATSLDGLVTQLRAFNGHRTVWIDESTGDIVHTEPEVELDALAYRYVATVLAPRRDELAVLLGAHAHAMPAGPPGPAMSLQLANASA